MQNFLSGNKDSLSKKASYLRFSAKTLVENLKLGSFRSLYKGQGVEFSGVREYLRGDDVRAIDWNVTARMGRPYVKVFDEEHELQIFLVVDRSASMFCGVNGIVKYETVAETAALLALVAEASASPIGAVFFDGEIHFSCKPASGKERTMLLLSKLDKVEKIKDVIGSGGKDIIINLYKNNDNIICLCSENEHPCLISEIDWNKFNINFNEFIK